MSLNQKVSALSLSGTGITTSYQAGSAFAAGRAARVEVEMTCVTLGSTNATSFQGKLQGSVDGTNDWQDVFTMAAVGSATPTPAVDQTENTSSSQTKGMVFGLAVGGSNQPWPFPFLRVAGKLSGGAGKAGESLSAVVRLSS